jgi:hypothetical protein
MKTRRTTLLLLALAGLTGAVLTGCMLSGGEGSLAFTFPTASRALGTGESYRVDLYYGLDRYRTEYATTETVELAGLPPGAVTVYVSQGTGTGTTFVARRVARLDLSIVPGDNTPGALNLANVPFDTALAGVGVSSVAATGAEIFAVTAQGLKRGGHDGATISLTDGPAVPAGMTARSVSVGKFFEGASDFKDQIWVNGTWNPASDVGAIVPWDTTSTPGSLNTQFAQSFGTATNWSSAGETAFTVVRSGSFSISQTDADDLAIFYQRNGGIGGVVITRGEASSYAGWKWITDQINLAEALGATGATGEPVLDFAPAADSVYAVTSVTTMKISVPAAGLAAFTDAQSFLSSPNVASATGIAGTITSVGLDTTNGFVYLGTQSGLWKGKTSATTSVFFDGTPARVSGTGGYAVQTITVSPDGARVAFVAGRAGGPDALGVLAGTALTVYRSPQGLPGETLNALAWLDTDTVLVGGNGGLAALDL